jgi:hypothetical protein
VIPPTCISGLRKETAIPKTIPSKIRRQANPPTIQAKREGFFELGEHPPDFPHRLPHPNPTGSCLSVNLLLE